MELLFYSIALALFVILMLLMHKLGWVNFRGRASGSLSGAANNLQGMMGAGSRKAFECRMDAARRAVPSPSGGKAPGGGRDGDHAS